MDFSKGNFTPQEKIELLQRWVLVHSYLYYNMDTSVVTDHKYDDNCRQLCRMKEDYQDSWANARYTYAMYDFDGSTGFGFVDRLKDKDLESVTFDVSILLNMNRYTLRRR
jgi:hypothetical protein